MLRRRAAVRKRLRAFFDGRGFLEIETPLLSRDVVVDRYIEPLIVSDERVDAPYHLGTAGRAASGNRWFLQTSPEFHMKRLLAAGSGPIYQVTRAFRGEENGRLHNPEFTIVEWYRPGDSYEQGMNLLGELAGEFLNSHGVDRVSYRDAFEQYVGIDPHIATVADLTAAAARHKLTPPGSLGSQSDGDRDGWLNFLLAELVEPQLGRERPAILCDYPASQAALSIIRDDDPPVAERFELYFRGIELANGYHELCDAAELRRRFALVNEQRIADGRRRLPEESRLLWAMEAGLPPTVGVALGFDRLVMLVTGATSLAEVMAFDWAGA